MIKNHLKFLNLLTDSRLSTGTINLRRKHAETFLFFCLKNTFITSSFLKRNYNIKITTVGIIDAARFYSGTGFT